MSAPAPRPAADQWALVGRDAELRAARSGLAGSGLVVCSRWGLGGSPFARAVVPRPWVRTVVTEAMAAQPLFAVRSLLDEADDTTDPVVAARHLRSAAARVGRRPVLVVDGWQHLDPASASVLLHLVGDGALRILAVREATAPVSAGEDASWRDLGLARVDLLPLGDAAMAPLLDEVLAGPVEGRTRRTLLAWASGNPGLLIEVVEASAASGVLARADGLWRLTGEPALSPRVLDLARAAVARLEPEGLAAAEVLAVAGPLPVAVLTDIANPAGAEALERAGLASVTTADGSGSSVIELCDPTVAAHLGRSVPVTARVRTREALARATEAVALAEDPDLFVRSAEWAVAAGRAADAQRLLQAARASIDLGDPGRAERLASASASLTPSTEAVLLESWCADECGAIERSERVLAEHHPDGDEAVVAVAIRRAEQQFWAHSDPESASGLLRVAADRVVAPWGEAIAAQAAMFDLIDGRSGPALDVALSLAEHDTRLVRSTASLAAALALVMDDRPVEAASVAEQALAGLAGTEPGLAIDPGVHIISLCFSFDGQGRWSEADELTDSVYRHALSRPGRQAQGWAALVRARVLTAQGRPAEAAAVALEAEQIWRDANLTGIARWSATVAGQAAASAGDRVGAAACLARIDAIDAAPFRLFEPEVERLRAWDACLRSEDGSVGASHAASAARARLADVASAAAVDGRRHLAALAAFDLVRLGDPALGAAVLDEIVARGASATTVRRLETASAVAAGDADGLEAIALAWEGTGAVGTAAECLAFAAAICPARAAALANRIEGLIAGSGLRTPPLNAVAELEGQQQLTPREREIVTLVAEGLSNRAIAEQLVVSTRTVENHLHRAYAKLGVASRSELIASPGT